MRSVLVTGSEGFIGRNLCQALLRDDDYRMLPFDRRSPADDLDALAARADIVFHLAGVNRPRDPAEYFTGNRDLTRRLCEALENAGGPKPLILSSSIQANQNNPYGRSKLAAEELVLDYHRHTGAPIYIYRFPNLFGKWSRPDYNSVVATFCHKIARGQSVQISDPENSIRFVYVDDVVQTFLAIASREVHSSDSTHHKIATGFTVTLGRLHDLLTGFQENRHQGLVPDLEDPFIRYLYATFLAFRDTGDFAYDADLRSDPRGWLFELVKSPCAGQVFVSSTLPGVTRGNHYHDTKIEKFCVIRGEAVIRFRHLYDNQVIEYPVSGRHIRIVDIPPGYTHSIENTGTTELLTLFWADEVFDRERPDTWAEQVLR